MQLNQKIDYQYDYSFEDVVDEIGASGITSICRTINKFNRIMDDDNVSSKNRDLENLVKNDVALATEVLRIANSPLFRAVNKNSIDNIANAIVIIGWDTIYKVGMSLTVKGLVKTSKARTFANWLVNRSIMIAHISEIFLESLRPYNTALSKINSVYAYGLIHDIGAIGMLQVIDDYQQDVMAIKLSDDKKSWSDAEEVLYGYNHNIVGEHILLESQLPRSFSIVARYHHDSETALPINELIKISLVRLAQLALIDTHKFSEHEPFSSYKSIENTSLIREYDDLSEDIQEEFEQRLGLNAKIYNEIRSTKLTDDFLNKISQQF